MRVARVRRSVDSVVVESSGLSCWWIDERMLAALAKQLAKLTRASCLLWAGKNGRKEGAPPELPLVVLSRFSGELWAAAKKLQLQMHTPPLSDTSALLCLVDKLILVEQPI